MNRRGKGTPSRKDDIVLLELLDARERVGMGGGALRDHMRGLTREEWSRGKVQGALFRIIYHEQPCHCRKPENQDGGMPERWWAA